MRSAIAPRHSGVAGSSITFVTRSAGSLGTLCSFRTPSCRVNVRWLTPRWPSSAERRNVRRSRGSGGEGIQVRDWPVWTLRRPALCYWLIIDLAALAVITCTIISTPTPSPSEIGRFAAIAGTAGAVVIGSSIYSHRLGETERNPWAAHLSYLTAGILALPPNLLVLLLFGPALHCLLAQRPETHRWLFTLS